MPATLTIRDESMTGGTTQEFTLEFLTERVTVRELIRSRVYQEVQDYNQKQPQVYRGLIQPTEAESALNGFRVRKGKQVEWKAQFERAVEAFAKNQMLILVDDLQAESLEEEIAIGAKTVVSFLKLTPLVGG